MRPARLLSAVFLFAFCAAAAPAELLWDNFITPAPGYDGRIYMTSEMNATVGKGSWTADDADFASAVKVESLRWAGCYAPEYQYTAEVVVLDASLNQVTSYTGLTYSVLGTYGPFYGYEKYNADVALPAALELPAGRYYFGVRLVGVDGRNMVLSTGNGVTRGSSVAMLKTPDFGYNDWVAINEYYGLGTIADVAFQVYGTPVPEPAAAMLLLSGLVLLPRRR